MIAINGLLGYYYGVTKAEVDALIAFYNATGGDSWTNNSGWITNPNVADWHGLVLTGGHVTRLDLDSNNLSGTVSDTIEDLEWLTVIDLHANSLTGTISLLNKSTITGFYIYNNSLTSIDLTKIVNATAIWCNLNSITAFDASDNTKVDVLYLQDNGLTESAVDAVLAGIYSSRLSYTDTNPVLNIGGTNAAPSATGLGYIEDLVYDPDGDGHNKWTITYTSPAYTNVTQAEVDALIDFYYATDGPNWATNTNWVTALDVSTWYGLTCSGGHVTEISLIGNDLAGAAGSTLDGLDWLTKLFVYGNNITSLDVTNLTAMLNLHIGNNANITFSGLSSLTNLLQFWCYSCDFTSLDTSSNTKMIGLYAYDNSFPDIDLSSNVKLRTTTLYDNAWTQTEVDDFIDYIYQARADFDYASTIACDISGTNAAPSGTYQYAATPSSGKEKIYALENDDDVEGFNLWSFTYN